MKDGVMRHGNPQFDGKPSNFKRYLSADGDEAIRNAIEKLDNEVYSYITEWTDNEGRTNAQVVLNYGTLNIPWKLEDWTDAMEEFCEYFDIRNGEAIVLYNIHERWLEPLDSYDLKSRFRSKGRFVPFLKRRK